MHAVDPSLVLDVDPFATEALADPVALHSAIREAAPAVWVPRRNAWFTGRDADLVIAQL